MLIDDCYAAYINLDHRTDRYVHMVKELSRVGLKAERFRGIRTNGPEWNKPPYERMFHRTRGAIGCYLTQLAVMQKALALGKHCLIMEDDLHFCEDFQDRIGYVEKFLSEHPWDIFWFGALFHCNPPHWHNGKNPLLPSSNLGYDANLTDDPHIIRTFGCFSTHCWLINREHLQEIITRFEELISRSIGIDYSAIILQPNLLTYTYVPGAVIQIDNLSDIGQGMTIYSGFSKLNGTKENSAYWFQEKKEDFNPVTFNWGEVK
jgi:GR25 family glycosyltransferase involved in LPS biosynthesis